MPVYRVTRDEVYTVSYNVLAENMQEAQDAFDHGEWDDAWQTDTEFSHAVEATPVAWEGGSTNA